jgi:ABC-2 type transport system ATP-binding protein
VAVAIEVESVSRVFAADGKSPPTVALDEVSLTVGEGEIVGLLGSNGAGKTTLTKIVATLLLPTSGTVRVFGVDVVARPREVRRHQSLVLGGDRGLYTRLSARENLRFFGMLDGLSRRELRDRLDGALSEVGLTDAADRKVEAFSKGMRQRLHLAIGMITRPRLLLLDEPTVGLDPVEAERLRAAIAALRDDGVAVLLTSHYLHDIEQLADRVVMLEQGRVTHAMSVEAFTRAAGHVALAVIRGVGPPPAFTGLPRHRYDVTVDAAGWVASVQVETWSADALTELAAIAGEAEVTGVDIHPARLEEAYIRLQSPGA